MSDTVKLSTGKDRRVRQASGVFAVGDGRYRRADGIVVFDQRTGPERRVASYRWLMAHAVNKTDMISTLLQHSLILALRSRPPATSEAKPWASVDELAEAMYDYVTRVCSTWKDLAEDARERHRRYARLALSRPVQQQDEVCAAGHPPIAVVLAVEILCNHVEPGSWENSKAIVRSWLDEERATRAAIAMLRGKP